MAEASEASDAYMIRKQRGQVEEICFSRSSELSIHWVDGQPGIFLLRTPTPLAGYK